MKPEDIRSHMRREPFRPVRFRIDDGSSYDILRNDVVLVCRSEVVIGLTRATNEYPYRMVRVAPASIVSVERI